MLHTIYGANRRICTGYRFKSIFLSEKKKNLGYSFQLVDENHEIDCARRCGVLARTGGKLNTGCT